ncbi:thiaminase/transcriptional activator TenA [Bisgaardia hudsonensis]|uniref:Aminopyrimidine aminohydrolase n=1 Tax=Bisgaardia hudsonensis TaxID=109472 RepID=A0A4R2N1R2_9PAST|nr:thiaminase II [Bisgaardia hudsonensis]QLB12923.1 thiaminase II [Bisgaardia hudsonensis]TCP13517.1 thiaminase/transcriptional activator TenA [Bisgaardia hudsonensis]
MSFTQKLIKNADPFWKDYVDHKFVQQLANGTLEKASFQHYLKQDYLYLFQYSRAISLGIFKANNFQQIETAHQANTDLLKEIQVHINFCKEWGISEKELFATVESPACVAYTRYVLDCGIKGGLPELYAALAPCAVGYAEIGRTIVEKGISPKNNPYQAWIDAYASEEFQQAAQGVICILDELALDLTENQKTNLQTIFNTATRMESGFWQMGLDLS